MSAENHRLVILGSMDEFVDLVECAKKRGIYTLSLCWIRGWPRQCHSRQANHGGLPPPGCHS